MSDYSLADIRADVKLAVVPDGNDQTPDDYYTRVINDAIRDIPFVAIVSELEATNSSLALVQNTRSYSLSGFDPLFIVSIKNTTSDQELYPIGRDQADAYDETETGEPIHYYRYGTSLEVYPLPSSSYGGDSLKVRFIKKPPTLSKEADTSPYDAYYDRAIREYATSAIFQMLNEPKKAAQHFGIYRAIVRERGNLRGKEMRFNPGSYRFFRRW